MHILHFYQKVILSVFILVSVCIFVGPALSQDKDEELLWQRRCIDYLRKVENQFDRTNGNYAIQYYIESYAIRSMLVVYDNYTNDNYDLNYAVNWVERMLSLQGTVLNPGAYDMGYDGTGYEKPLGWYPADCSCIALAVLAVAKNPQIISGQQERYIYSARLFADYVIENWRNPNGSIQSGWRNSVLNPIQEFWIATSLFSSVAWELYDVTKIEKYKTVALEALDWLLEFDFKHSEVTPGTSFNDGIPTFVFYLGEGLITNAEYLRDNEEYYSKIKKKLKSVIDLVLDNQRADGGLDCSVLWWRQKIPAMYSVLDWYYRNMDQNERVNKAAQNILKYSFSKSAEVELRSGLHTQTTTFTFFSLASKCVPNSVFPKPRK